MKRNSSGKPMAFGRRHFCKLAAGVAFAPSVSWAARDAMQAHAKDAVHAAFYVAVGATLTVYRPDTDTQTLVRDSTITVPQAAQYAWPASCAAVAVCRIQQPLYDKNR
jgi:6-phosphogluconolactonase